MCAEIFEWDWLQFHLVDYKRGSWRSWQKAMFSKWSALCQHRRQDWMRSEKLKKRILCAFSCIGSGTRTLRRKGSPDESQLHSDSLCSSEKDSRTVAHGPSRNYPVPEKSYTDRMVTKTIHPTWTNHQRLSNLYKFSVPKSKTIWIDSSAQKTMKESCYRLVWVG